MKINKEVNELAREIKNFSGNEELTWSDCVGEAIKTLRYYDIKESNVDLELTGSEKQIKWAQEIISRNPSYPKKFVEIVNGKWLLKEGFSFLNEEQKKSCMKEVMDSSFWINVEFKDLNKACHSIGIRIKKELGYTPLSMHQAMERLKEGVIVDPLCDPKEFIYPEKVFGEIEDDEDGFYSVIWKENGEKKYYEHEGKWLSPSEWEI